MLPLIFREFELKINELGKQYKNILSYFISSTNL